MYTTGENVHHKIIKKSAPFQKTYDEESSNCGQNHSQSKGNSNSSPHVCSWKNLGITYLVLIMKKKLLLGLVIEVVHPYCFDLHFLQVQVPWIHLVLYSLEMEGERKFEQRSVLHPCVAEPVLLRATVFVHLDQMMILLFSSCCWHRSENGLATLLWTAVTHKVPEQVGSQESYIVIFCGLSHHWSLFSGHRDQTLDNTTNYGMTHDIQTDKMRKHKNTRCLQRGTCLLLHTQGDPSPDLHTLVWWKRISLDLQ